MPLTFASSSRPFWQRFEPLAVSVAVIGLIINGVLSYQNVQHLREHEQSLTHSLKVLYAVESFQASLIDVETGGRGYLLNGDESFLSPYESGQVTVADELAKIRRLIANNPHQQAKLPAITEAAAKTLDQISGLVARRSESRLEESEVASEVAEGKRLMDETRRLISDFQTTERLLLLDRQHSATKIHRDVILSTVLSTCVGLVLVGSILYAVYRNRIRIQYAADLVHSERERLLKTLGGIRDAVISTDRHGSITYMNSVAEDLSGHSFAEASGQRLDAVIRLVDEKGDQSDQQTPSAFPLHPHWLHDQESETRDWTYRLVSVNGQETLVELSLSRLRGRDAKLDGGVVVLRDLSQRQKLERIQNERLVTDRQLAMFVEQVSDYAIFLIDPQLKAATWNRGVEQVLGLSEEEFIGSDILTTIFLPESISDGSAAREFELARRNGEASDDRWMMRKDGEPFWASGITTAVYDNDGKLLGYNKVLRNLTDRKLAEDALKSLAAELSEADRNKTTFLATLAHELRNPLSPIKNTVQLLHRAELPGEAQDLLEVVERQVEQMVRLIDDLMDVSRISRGKVELRRELVSLRPIVDSAIEASESLIAGNGQRFSLHCPDQDIFLYVDPARISQVISNLLNNASKYSPTNTEIILQIDRMDDQVQIIVRDHGIGIDAADLEEVFKMFSQLSEQVERGSSGLGIGLTLVQNFVRMHGGTVTAASPGLGHGCTFTIRLPMADPADLAPVSDPRELDQTPIRSFKILIVDDTRAITFVMQRLLMGMNQQIQTASNGLEALEVIKDFEPDIIFSDISMPGMNGYELVTQLRNKNKFRDKYIVAMTGFGQPTDRDKALAAGFDDHVIKPVDYSVIEGLLRKRSRDGLC